MVKILFFGDLVDTLGMASDEIALPPDVTDVERTGKNAISYTAIDMIDASRFFSAIGFLQVDK